ncbi:MAG: hypothetical protein ACRD2L_15635, partial [Terriglobia bacterium]
MLACVASAHSSCTSVNKDKWLVYELRESESQTPLYVGYKSFADDKRPDLEKLRAIRQDFLGRGLLPGKPTIHEKDDSHVLVYLPPNTPAKCAKEEKGFNQTDAAVVPPTPGGVANLGEAEKGLRETEQRNLLSPFFCDLNTRGKGSVQVKYKVLTTKDGKEESKLDDSVNVHALYRFRVMAGPVYSTLIKKNKDYKVVTDSSGNKVVSSSSKNDSPVNFPLFLKVYWAPEGRDILDDDPPIWYRFNPIVGINLVDRPLGNFYLGLSFEPPFFRGLDIVGGAHWSKQTRLAGGFSEGPTTADAVPTTEKFVNGWFVGATVDI